MISRFGLLLTDDRPGVLLDHLDGVRLVILDLYIRHHVSQLCPSVISDPTDPP